MWVKLFSDFQKRLWRIWRFTCNSQDIPFLILFLLLFSCFAFDQHTTANTVPSDSFFFSLHDNLIILYYAYFHS